MNADIALSSVVLPEPVPPEMIVVLARVHDGRRALRPSAGGMRADLDQPVQAERLLGELADREQRPVDAERRGSRR